CGDGRTEPPKGPPTIRTAPVDQVVGVGQTATFIVDVDTGNVPTTYQWFWNGWKLGDATRPSFTTRPSEVADNASTYSVEAMNFYGSVSASATLTVSPVPREPKVGDLRFQGVDAAPVRIPLETINFISRTQALYLGVAGTPLLTGSGLCGPSLPYPPPRTCSWGYMAFIMPPTAPRTNVLYTNGDLSGLESVLNSLAAPDASIRSFYLETLEAPPAQGALSRVQARDGGVFEPTRHAVPADELPSAIAREGAASRVVTAIYFHGGIANFFSYGWTGDLT